ncbi:ATP-binding protein [Oleidesulfovibrio sp.]|uniref:ATP-binding protein n=1 Tax=Oleidesulfovibrio sp. TaxID=2909707 RepID=UPI003A88ECE9
MSFFRKPIGPAGLSRNRIFSFLAASILAVFFCALISVVYYSQRQLLEADYSRISDTAQKQAAAVSYLLDEIKLDIALLFRQQALVDLVTDFQTNTPPSAAWIQQSDAIRQLLREFASGKTVNEKNIYRRITVFSASGKIILDTGDKDVVPVLPSETSRLIKQNIFGPHVVALSPDVERIKLALPILNKGTRVGYAVITCSTRAIQAFLKSLWDLDTSQLILMQGSNGILLSNNAGIAPDWPRLNRHMQPALLYALDKYGQLNLLQRGMASNNEIGIRYPVANSPFDLLVIFNDDAMGTYISPDMTLIVISVLSGILAVFGYNVFRVNMRARILKAHAEAASASEKRILEQNAHLNEEIRERTNAEAALREAKEQAEAASKAKGEFLANISHEFRTPMNAIIGMSEVVLRTELTPPQKKHLTVLNKAAHSLLQLLNSILDFSRYESEKATLCLAPFQLRAPFTHAYEMFSEGAKKKGIELSLHFSDNLPENVLADEGKIQQIIVNLVGNALKYTHAGKVAIECKAEDSPQADIVNVIFSVTDTGIGIAPEMHQLIFESFTQAEGTYTKAYGGTGLGLSICKLLVNLMEGEIALQSSPGAGSVFSVSLPLHKLTSKHAAPDDVHSAIAYTSSRPLSILVAEDNTFNQEVIKEILEMGGHSVTLAGNGKEALEILEKQDFDLLLLDVQMPVMDGVQTARIIKTGAVSRHSLHMPIVALTAYSMKGDQERFLDAGMSYYLAKPVIPDTLYTLLEKIIKDDLASPETAEPDERSFDFGTIPPPDLEMALTMLSGKKKVLNVMLGTFVRTMPERIDALSQGIEAKDVKLLGELGHALKSPLHSIGSLEGRYIAEELEKAYRTDNPERALMLAPLLVEAVGALIEFLRQQHDT